MTDDTTSRDVHAPDVTARDARVRERQTLRTARYVVVGEEPARARRIWFVLHGYGMLAGRFVRPFAGVIPADTCIIAPEALSRFYLEMPRADGGHQQRIGATWLTRESRETEIADAHRWLDAVYDEVIREASAAQHTPPAVAVLGFSQGVATAMRWIASGHVAPQQFVAWAGGLAHDVPTHAVHARTFAHRMQGERLLIVSGTEDPFATGAARESIRATLDRLGVTYRARTFDGAHQLDAPLLGTLLADFTPDA